MVRSVLSPLTSRLFAGSVLGVLIAVPLQVEYAASWFRDDLQWLPALLGLFLGGTLGLLAWALRGPLSYFRPERPGLLSAGLIGLLLLAFGFEYWAGVFDSSFAQRLPAFLTVGAFAPTLVRDGELWRVLTAPLLSGGTVHVVVNAITLALLVPMLKRNLHSATILLIFFAGPAIAALVVAAMVPHGFAALSSAGPFCLMGALISSQLSAPEGTPAPTIPWRVLIASLLAWAASVPLGHGGVNIFALLLGVALTIAHSALTRTRLPLGATVGSGLLLVGVTSSVAVVFAYDARETNMQDTLQVVDTIRDSTLLNEAAWDIATAADSDTAQLELALRFSKRSVELKPERTQFQDTMATLQYRLGDHVKAAEIELKAAIVNHRPFYWSQIQRFLAANRAETGQLLATGKTRSESVHIEQRNMDSGRATLVMWWPKGAHPSAVLEVSDQEQAPLGSLLLVGTGTTTGSQRFVLPSSVDEFIDEGAELQLVWILDNQPDTRPGVTFFGHDTDVDHLP